MQRFKNILFVTDAITGKEEPLERAVTLARRNGARVTVIDVVEKLSRDTQMLIPSMHPKDIEEMRTQGRMRWLEVLISLVEHEDIRLTPKILWGTPFLEIIREVMLNQHDLVMITAEGKGGLKERLFGSTTMHLMRKCPCPVWVLKPTQRQSYARILAAVDPSDDERNALNEKILELGSSLAEMEGSELHIVHTWTPIKVWGLGAGEEYGPEMVDEIVRETQEAHEKCLAELLGKYDLAQLKHQVHLLKGEAGALIPALAKQKEIDLIVMGTVCRTGIPGFFIGNTAETVLQHVDCSVLTVKPDRFVTPVTLDES